MPQVALAFLEIPQFQEAGSSSPSSKSGFRTKFSARINFNGNPGSFSDPVPSAQTRLRHNTINHKKTFLTTNFSLQLLRNLTQGPSGQN